MMKQEEARKRYMRNDIVVIAVLLVLAAVGAVYLFVFRQRGDAVKVTIDGEVYGLYALNQDRVEDIGTGEKQNRLVIRDGKAFVETATCPDGICAEHRAIFRDGESIICLPHRVVITVISDKAEAAPDAVA